MRVFGLPLALLSHVAPPRSPLLLLTLLASLGPACESDRPSFEGPDGGSPLPSADAQCQGELCSEPAECHLDDDLADLIEQGGADPALLELRYVSQLELPYPAIWHGVTAISQSNGAHNQGLALSSESIFTTAQDREQDGWLFVHDRDSLTLQCAARLAPNIFGASSTGRVHPGGGFFHDGWMYTAISNHPDLLQPSEGRFILAKFRYDAAACGAGQADCECQVDYEKDVLGRAKVYDSRAYHGLVLRVEDSSGAHMMVFDINGDNPWICDGETGEGCVDLKSMGLYSEPDKTREILENKTTDKPQQCFTLGRAPSRYQLCTPFPTGGMRLSVHEADPHAEVDGLGIDGLGFFRKRLTSLAFPTLSEDQFGEGAVFDEGQLFVAGDAPVRANCGFASVVKPCTSKDSKQVVRVYEFAGLSDSSCR